MATTTTTTTTAPLPPPPAASTQEKEPFPHTDIEKSTTPHNTDSSSDVAADSTLIALQRVRSADAHHPMHWGAVKKWNIVFWYCLLQFFVTLSTTTYIAAEFTIGEKFGGSTQVIALGQSMFIIGTAVGPAFLGPLS